jgi:hypothetical protein
MAQKIFQDHIIFFLINAYVATDNPFPFTKQRNKMGGAFSKLFKRLALFTKKDMRILMVGLGLFDETFIFFSHVSQTLQERPLFFTN